MFEILDKRFKMLLCENFSRRHIGDLERARDATRGASGDDCITGSSRDQGATGAVIADVGGRLAFGYSGKWWDLFGAVEMQAGSLAHTTARSAASSAV